MPARPLNDESLHLIYALRTALSARSDVQERSMFGIYCFFVDDKLCLGVKNGELLVRLPPEQHGQLLETQNTRELSPGGGMQGYFWIEPNGFASASQWRHWMDEALAYNPRAKASPRRKARAAAGRSGATAADTTPTETSKPAKPGRHAQSAQSDKSAKSDKSDKSAKSDKTAAPASPQAPRRHSIFESDDDEDADGS